MVPLSDTKQAWLIEDHRLPVIQLQLTFSRAGGAYNSHELAGLSAFYGDMLLQGAGDKDALAFYEAMEAGAIELGAYATEDHLIVQMKTLTEHADEAFALLTSMLLEPRFDAGEMEKTRENMLQDLRRNQEQPSYLAYEAWQKAYYGEHPYGIPQGGTSVSLKRISRDELVKFQTTLARDQLTVSAVGDISSDTLRKQLTPLLSALPEATKTKEIPDFTRPHPNPLPEGEGISGESLLSSPIVKNKDSAAPFPLPAGEGQGEGALFTLKIAKDLPQTTLIFGQQGVPYDHPDFYALYVLNHILGGGGFSSRLLTEIRERRGLVYSLSTFLDYPEHAATLQGMTATKSESAAQSVALIKEEFARMKAEGVTADELRDAKRYLTGSFPLRIDSNAELLRYLTFMQLKKMDTDFLRTRNVLIENVTLEQVNRAAKTYLTPESLFFVEVGR